jgi:transcriptional regulator with XRE-family HTH domain
MKELTPKRPKKQRALTRLAREKILPLGTPNPIDVHVGSRVRLRWTLLGLSQEKLGEMVNLTFQQIQKYERGSNRIGSSRLCELGKIFDVPVSFFFDDMPDDVQAFGSSGNPTRAGWRIRRKPQLSQIPWRIEKH